MATKGAVEAEDSTLKRRARRRLIGAIALVLLAVIVLPMVFDAEKKPLDADISIQIPNKDALVTKGPGAVAPPPPSPPQMSQGSAPAVMKGDVPDTAKAGVKAEPAPASRSELNSEPRPESKAAPSIAAKVDDQRAAQERAEEKRAAAILNAQSDTVKVAKSADKSAPAPGAFAVQVGAFAGEDKIREARDKLAAAGIKTYTEKLDTKDGERTRVRAGPFTGKDVAETARDRIRDLGFAGAVVVAR